MKYDTPSAARACGEAGGAAMLKLNDQWIWDFWTYKDGPLWHIWFLQRPTSRCRTKACATGTLPTAMRPVPT